MKLLEMAVRLFCSLAESEALVGPATLWSWERVQESLAHDPALVSDLGALTEAERERVLRYTGAFEPLSSLGDIFEFATPGAAQNFVKVMEATEGGAEVEVYTPTIVHAFGNDPEMMADEAALLGGKRWTGATIHEAVERIDTSLPWDMYCDGIPIATVQECLLRAVKAPVGLLSEGTKLVGSGPESAFAGRLRAFYTPRAVDGVPAYVTEALRIGGFLSDQQHIALLSEADPGQEGDAAGAAAPAKNDKAASAATDRGGVADTQPDQTQGGAAQSQSGPVQEPEKPTEHRPTEEQGAPDGDVTLPDGTVVPKEVLQQAFVKFLDRLKAKLQSGTESGQPTPRGGGGEPKKPEPKKPEGETATEQPPQPEQPPAPSQPAATQPAGQPQAPPQQEAYGDGLLFLRFNSNDDAVDFYVDAKKGPNGRHVESVRRGEVVLTGNYNDRAVQDLIRDAESYGGQLSGMNSFAEHVTPRPARLADACNRRYESVDTYIPVVLPKGIPHRTRPIHEGTSGRVIGTKGRRVVVEAAGVRFACKPERVLVLAEGYDTDHALFDLAAGADPYDVARKRLGANQGVRMENAAMAQAALDEVAGAVAKAVGGVAKGAAQGAVAGAKEGAQSAVIKQATKSVGIKSDGGKADLKKAAASKPAKKEENINEGTLSSIVRDIRDMEPPGVVQKALIARAEMLYDPRPAVQQDAVDAFHDAYAAMSKRESDRYFRLARDLGLEESRIEEALGPERYLATVRKHLPNYYVKLVGPKVFIKAAEGDPRSVMVDLLSKETYLWRHGRDGGGGDRILRGTFVPDVVRLVHKYLGESVSTFVDAGTCTADSADTSQTPKMTAPQHTGAAQGTAGEEDNPGNYPAPIGKKYAKGTPARGLGESLSRGDVVRLKYDPYGHGKYKAGDLLVVTEVGPRRIRARRVGAEFERQGMGWAYTDFEFPIEAVEYVRPARSYESVGGPDAAAEVRAVIGQMERLVEELDTGEDAEREAAAQGFADAAERLKALRQAAFQLTTDDLVRLSSIMAAMGNKSAASKLEKLRIALGNIADVAKKAGDELKKAHGAAGVGEAPDGGAAPAPKNGGVESSPEAEGSATAPPTPEGGGGNGEQAPVPEKPTESVMEAASSGFRKAMWKAKNTGPFQYGQVVWVLPEATRGDREVWVAQDPHTRLGIYADRGMVEMLERDFRDEAADTMIEVAIRRVLHAPVKEAIMEGEDYDITGAAVQACCGDLGVTLEQVAEIHRVARHGIAEEFTVSVDSRAHAAMSRVDDPIVQRLVMDTDGGMVARVPGAVLMEVARVLRHGPDPDQWQLADMLEACVRATPAGAESSSGEHFEGGVAT